MSNKYFGGVVENRGAAEPVDDDLKAFALEVPGRVTAKMDKLRVAVTPLQRYSPCSSV